MNDSLLTFVNWVVHAGIAIVFMGSAYIIIMATRFERKHGHPKIAVQQKIIPVRIQFLLLAYIVMNIPTFFKKRPVYAISTALGTVFGFYGTYIFISLSQPEVKMSPFATLLWFCFMLCPLFSIWILGVLSLTEWRYGGRVRDDVNELLKTTAP